MCCEMVNLENMPSEISQSLKDKYYVIPLVWDSLSSSVYALLLYTSIIYVDKINSVSYKSPSPGSRGPHMSSHVTATNTQDLTRGSAYFPI